ncbi:sigma-70 family RNA polymerase sigma factor [Kitasatospora sp. NPDC004240]
MDDPDGTALADLPDTDLTSLARDGSPGAVAELYDRHRAAVLAYARTCTHDPHTAEDLTAEAFTRTLSRVHSGAGPSGPWRPYLLVAVRNLAADWAAGGRRTRPTDDIEELTTPLPAAAGGEQIVLRRESEALMARSFRSLPERWQRVLWHTVVEERTADSAGAALGLSASGVWSLAERAREGLREAYLTAHVHRPGRSPECEHYSALLAKAVRRSGRGPDRALAGHLADCTACRTAFDDIRDLNSRLRAVLPLLLPAGPGAVGGAAGAMGAGGGTGAGGTGAGGATGAGGPAAATALPGAPAGVPPWVAFTAATLVVAGALGTAVHLAAPESAPWPVPPPGTAVRPPAPAPSAVDRSADATGSPAPATPTATAPSASVPPVNRTRLRIDSTGLCMDIAQTAGAQPREAPCTGNAAQSWDLVPAAGAGRRIAVRNAASGLCLAHSGGTTDGAPVRQAVCDGGARQTWTLNRAGDGRVGILTGEGMHLGLKEWARADRQTHDPLIATTHFYYGSPSLRFRPD